MSKRPNNSNNKSTTQIHKIKIDKSKNFKRNCVTGENAFPNIITKPSSHKEATSKVLQLNVPKNHITGKT